MTRMLIAAGACLAIVSLLHAESKEQGLVKLQGKWRVERIEENGVPEPDAEAKRFTLTIRSARIIVEMDGRTENTDFRIDPEKTPMEIDLVPQYGADKGKTFRGIYELDGDTLRICATPLPERPKRIASGDNIMIMILKRAKD